MKKFRHLTLHDFSKKRMTAKQISFLCTISGGQDSILTFFLLVQTKKKKTLHNLYCHHFWQLKNFFSARFIFQLTYLFKVSYTLILPQTSILTENESRDWRKKNFCRVSQIARISTSLLGHTETDTLEKNLNNLLRGTSPAGLSYSSFLNSQNRASIFFSSITLTSKKHGFPRKGCQRLLFFSRRYPLTKNSFCQWDNLKIKKLDFEKSNKIEVNRLKQKRQKKKLTPILTKSSLKSSRSHYNQRKKFEFYKQQNIFFNQFSAELPVQKNSLCNRVNAQTMSQKRSFGTKKNTFINQTELCSTKSYSFSVSNNYSNMRVNVIKPLQKTTRCTVSKVINLYNLPNFIDVTNFSCMFSRNKIRHQLLPFMRSLVHVKIESLVTNFFKILQEEHQDREKELQELTNISKIGNLNSRKKNHFTKNLIKTVSRNTLKSFSQKLFFDYKNLSLNYSQLIKIHEFL